MPRRCTLSLRRVLVTEEDLARFGNLEAGDDAQQRRLARAGRPEQRHQLAGADVEADPAQGRRGAELLDDAGDANVQGDPSRQWARATGEGLSVAPFED